MALCMPSAFSNDPYRFAASIRTASRRVSLAAGLVGLTSWLLWSPLAQARGQLAWMRAVFPVVGFAGYSSPYGPRLHPLSGSLRSHDGIDIAAPLGATVRSWWAGRLLEVIDDSGCGHGLVVRSGDYDHIYCHLGGEVGEGTYRSGSVRLRTGQWVGAGQTLGQVGLTGATTGPHLHWGLRYRGALLDPARVLRAMAASRTIPRNALARQPKLVGFR